MASLSTLVIDTNETTKALTGNPLTLIKYHSNAYAEMTLNGAVMALGFCAIINGDKKVWETSHTFENVESNKFTFYCEDDVYNPYEKEVTVPMVDYIPLTCKSSRPTIDGEGNAVVKCMGDYFNGSFGAESNTLSVQCRYKAYGGVYGEWTDMYVTENNTTYNASASLTVPDYQGSYSFEFRAADSLMTATVSEASVRSIPVFHWGRDSFTHETDVRIGGKALGEYDAGYYLRFGNGNYCYIAETADNEITIKASSAIYLNSADVYINGYSIDHGTWTPYLYPSPDGMYSIQEGWYSKFGNTVIIGFYIKASCPLEWEDTPVIIEGLPYTPACRASGGGMCSGAYVSGGYNFQCFVAETNGTITTRVQQCNNTSASNLSTSASGCYFGSGGGDITVSGTITYLTY